MKSTAAKLDVGVGTDALGLPGRRGGCQPVMVRSIHCLSIACRGF